MLDLHFYKNNENSYDVQSYLDENGFDYELLGQLEYNHSQDAWVFWGAGSDDGVTYEESLEYTMEELSDDLTEGVE